MIAMMSFFKTSQALKNALSKNTAAMKCPTEELMRLEFLLSLVSPESKSHRSSTECIQISFSQCSRLSTATFKMGTPGKSHSPIKTTQTARKMCPWDLLVLPWSSDILTPVFLLWAVIWLFPRKSVFWPPGRALRASSWQHWPLPITSTWCWLSPVQDLPEHLLIRYRSLDSSLMFPREDLQCEETLLALKLLSPPFTMTISALLTEVALLCKGCLPSELCECWEVQKTKEGTEVRSREMPHSPPAFPYRWTDL